MTEAEQTVEVKKTVERCGMIERLSPYLLPFLPYTLKTLANEMPNGNALIYFFS